MKTYRILLTFLQRLVCQSAAITIMNGVYRQWKGSFRMKMRSALRWTRVIPVLYEVYEFKRPEVAGELLHGVSVIHPGLVGNEFFMTKGHFHSLLETAEVYYCLKGEGGDGDGNAGRGLGRAAVHAWIGAVCAAALGAPFGEHQHG